MWLHKLLTLLIIIILMTSIITVVAQDEDDEDEYMDDTHGSSVLVVEHSFQQGVAPEFKKRGTVHIRSITSGNAQFKEEGGVTDEDIQELKDAAKADGIYRVRIRTKRDTYVSSFIKACALLESKMKDTLVINMDTSGNLIGISLKTNVPYCLNTDVSSQHVRHFHTDVDLRTAVTGPTAQVETYVKKIEQEKREKAEGQQADNRSFLQKYWMYIIPVVIFMMFAQTADQGQGGGGK